MAVTEKKRRARPASREKRREQLIDATMKCIGRKGISGTTLADVAREAGLSQGIVNLHFDSKDNLLRQTLERLAGDYRARFERALEEAGATPAQRLRALLMLDLHPSVCRPDRLAVWFAFWGEVKARPTYRRICDEVDRYYDDVVESLCADVIEDGDYAGLSAATVANALTAMTSGLWLSCLISPRSFDRDRATAAIDDYLAHVFPAHFSKEDHR